MFEVQIPKTIHNVFAIFFNFGLWSFKNEKSLTERGRKLFYFIYFVSFFVSLGVGAFNNNGEDDFMFLAVCTIIIGVQICRMYCVICNKEEILQLIFEIGTNSTNDRDEFVLVDNKIKNLIKFGQFFIFMMSCSFCFLMLSPFALDEKTLVFKVGFPLDWKTDGNAFWMAYVYVGGGFFLSAICCLLTVTIWYLMFNFTIQYEILGNRLRNLGVSRSYESVKPSKKMIKVSVDHNSYLGDLIAAIKTYDKINESLELFALVFSNLFFLQIATSSACICGSVYYLGFSSHGNWIQVIINCIVVAYNLFDVFMVMVLGNEIKCSSDNLSYCLFESNWLHQKESVKMYVLILTERLKQPQELLVGKLFPLNLDMFTIIVKRAYSMFNILQSLRK